MKPNEKLGWLATAGDSDEILGFTLLRRLHGDPAQLGELLERSAAPKRPNPLALTTPKGICGSSWTVVSLLWPDAALDALGELQRGRNVLAELSGT